MQERDPFPFRADTGCVVDEAHAMQPATVERGIKIVYGEADVVHARSSLGDEFADRRVLPGGFEQFDERFAGGEPGNAGAVSVIERHNREAEDVAIEGKARVESAHGDADVGDARAATGISGHQGALRKVGGASKVTLSEE